MENAVKPKRENCILDLDSPSYPPTLDEYWQCGCRTCLRDYIKEAIKKEEALGNLDPNCKMCREVFYPEIEKGNFNVFAPRHKASLRCRSGKYPHCTCDTCF